MSYICITVYEILERIILEEGKFTLLMVWEGLVYGYMALDLWQGDALGGGCVTTGQVPEATHLVEDRQ